MFVHNTNVDEFNYTLRNKGTKAVTVAVPVPILDWQWPYAKLYRQRVRA